MKKPVITSGLGVLRMRGFEGEVAYEINGDTRLMRAGGPSSPASKPLGGKIVATPEVAVQAFREGRCFITLEDGRQCQLTVVGYTDGEDRAFVQAQAI